MSIWNIDPAHSVAEFKVKHMMISNVKGQFTALKGSIQLDETDITNSSIEATIAVNSLSTGEPQRDAHLKSADFFDADTYATMNFKSTEVAKRGEGELSVAGDLTIHGITLPVVFAVEGPSAPGKDPWGNTRVGISAATKISRKDFGLTWNAALETGGILVGEEVYISLEVEFIHA